MDKKITEEEKHAVRECVMTCTTGCDVACMIGHSAMISAYMNAEASETQEHVVAGILRAYLVAGVAHGMDRSALHAGIDEHFDAVCKVVREYDQDGNAPSSGSLQ